MSKLSEFLGALDALAPAGGISYRGLTDDPSSIPVLGIMILVAASSRDPRVASENFTSKNLLVLLNRTGRDLSQLSQDASEREIVQRPSTLWHRLPDLSLPMLRQPLIVLEEVLPGSDEPPIGWPSSLVELKTIVSAEILAAQAAEPHTVRFPGKFAGEWKTQIPELNKLSPASE